MKLGSKLSPKVKTALKVVVGLGFTGGLVYLLNRLFAGYEVSSQQADVLPALDSTSSSDSTGGSTVNFDTAIDPLVQPYAAQMRAAGDQYGASPWLLAGIMMRESNGGSALTPPGPGGVGDKSPRWPAGSPNLKGALPSKYAVYADPNTGFPPGLVGWGLGLMQLDFGAMHSFVTSNDWTDPQTNINGAAQVLSSNLVYFARVPLPTPVSIESWRGWDAKYGVSGMYADPRPLTGDLLIRAAVAAYNAGTGGVLEAVAAGLDPDVPTTGGDYSSWVMQHIQQWSGQSSVPTTA